MTRANADPQAIEARHKRRRQLAGQLARSTGLPRADVRIENLSWALLGLDLAKAEMLRGRLTDCSPWQRVADSLQALCPRSDALRVTWVYECQSCKAKHADDPEPRDAAPVAGQIKPLPASPAAPALDPAPAATPAATADAPANVVPIKPPKPPVQLGTAVAMANAPSNPFSMPVQDRILMSRFDNRNY